MSLTKENAETLLNDFSDMIGQEVLIGPVYQYIVDIKIVENDGVFNVIIYHHNPNATEPILDESSLLWYLDTARIPINPSKYGLT